MKIKNLLLIFISLLTFVNVSYASFPVVESNLKILAIEHEDDEDDEDDGIKWGLLILFLSVLGFGAYFLIKSWRRAWIDDIRWVRILTNVILGILLLILLLVGICSVVKGGCVYNMQ